MTDKATKAIVDKIKKFIATENLARLTYTVDIYTEKESFIAIQGMNSEVYAKNVAAILNEDKKYKILNLAIVISNDNYKVVQIKKNLEEYLSPQKMVTSPIPTEQQPISQPTAPIINTNNITSPDDVPTNASPQSKKAAKTRPPGASPK